MLDKLKERLANTRAVEQAVEHRIESLNTSLTAARDERLKLEGEIAEEEAKLDLVK